MRVNISTVFSSNEEFIEKKLVGSFEIDKQVLIYNDGEFNYEIDFKNYSLRRYNDEYEVIFYFDTNRNTYALVNILNGISTSIEISTDYFKLGKNFFDVKYLIVDSNNLIEFKCEWEEFV